MQRAKWGVRVSRVGVADGQISIRQGLSQGALVCVCKPERKSLLVCCQSSVVRVKCHEFGEVNLESDHGATQRV